MRRKSLIDALTGLDAHQIDDLIRQAALNKQGEVSSEGYFFYPRKRDLKDPISVFRYSRPITLPTQFVVQYSIEEEYHPLTFDFREGDHLFNFYVCGPVGNVPNRAVITPEFDSKNLEIAKTGVTDEFVPENRYDPHFSSSGPTMIYHHQLFLDRSRILRQEVSFGYGTSNRGRVERLNDYYYNSPYDSSYAASQGIYISSDVRYTNHHIRGLEYIAENHPELYEQIFIAMAKSRGQRMAVLVCGDMETLDRVRDFGK